MTFEELTELNDFVEQTKSTVKFFHNLPQAIHYYRTLLQDQETVKKNTENLRKEVVELQTLKDELLTETSHLTSSVKDLAKEWKKEQKRIAASHIELEENHAKAVEAVKAEFETLSHNLAVSYKNDVEKAQADIAQLKTEIDALTQSRDDLLQKFALLRP